MQWQGLAKEAQSLQRRPVFRATKQGGSQAGWKSTGVGSSSCLQVEYSLPWVVPLFGSSLLDHQNFKSQGQKTKNFASGSVGVIVRETTKMILPCLHSWTHEMWLWEKQYHILETDLKHIP